MRGQFRIFVEFFVYIQENIKVTLSLNYWFIGLTWVYCCLIDDLFNFEISFVSNKFLSLVMCL